MRYTYEASRHVLTRDQEQQITVLQLLEALKCDFKLEWIGEGCWVVKDSDLDNIYYGHVHKLVKSSEWTRRKEVT